MLRAQKQKHTFFISLVPFALVLLQNDISLECFACVTSRYIVFGTNRKQKLKHIDTKIYKSVRPNELAHQCIDVRIGHHKQLHINYKHFILMQNNSHLQKHMYCGILKFQLCNLHVTGRKNVPDFWECRWMGHRLRFTKVKLKIKMFFFR